MATVREHEPAVVRAYSCLGDELGLARLPRPNVVHAPPGSVVGALVKVARLP